MIFPRVTGKRLTAKKPFHVNSGKSAPDFPMVIQNDDAVPALTTKANGFRNILTTQGSKPTATKAETGKMMDSTLSVVVRALWEPKPSLREPCPPMLSGLRL
jgi:hypothetical protein